MMPEAKILVEEQCWQTFDVSITTTATYFTPLSLLRCYYLTGQWMKPKVKTHGGTMLAGLWHHHCYSYNLRFTVIFVLTGQWKAKSEDSWRNNAGRLVTSVLLLQPQIFTIIIVLLFLLLNRTVNEAKRKDIWGEAVLADLWCQYHCYGYNLHSIGIIVIIQHGSEQSQKWRHLRRGSSGRLAMLALLL